MSNPTAEAAKAVFTGDELPKLVDALYPDGGLPGTREEVTTAVELAMGQLSERWQKVLRMSLLEGKSPEEIVAVERGLHTHVLAKIWTGTQIDKVRLAISGMLQKQS